MTRPEPAAAAADAGRTTTRVLLGAALGLVVALTGPPPADAQTVARSLEVDGRARSYFLRVPRGLPEDRPAPLVLVFHGGGGTGPGTERLTRFSDLAEREGFIAAYPEGIGRGWNDGREAPAKRAYRESVDDVAFVSALIDALATERPVDLRRVYATGISNGAFFSHYLAARLSRRIAAIAPVVGGMADPFHRAFDPAGPVAVLILQGTADPLVPYGGGPIAFPGRGSLIDTELAVRLWVERNATAREPVVEVLPDRDPADGCTARRFTYREGREGTEVVLYRLEGGGHTWPGGAQYLPERIIGRVCREIDATAVIWEFFKAHHRKP
jgi:polyhydroxybutyrate depolymerase